MTTSKKIEAVEVTFHFESDVTAADYTKVKSRVQRYINGTEFETTAFHYVTRNEVKVVISYDITGENEFRIYDYLGKRLTVLIDGHKQPAFYCWFHSSLTQQEKVGA